MSTTSIAKDILEAYPDAYIGIDCADKIEFELNTTTVLPSTQVSQFVELFGPNAACSVNLESKLVTISGTSVKFKKFPLLKSKLVATTESEKAAVQFADALNVTHGCAAEFHDNTCHKCPNRFLARRSRLYRA